MEMIICIVGHFLNILSPLWKLKSPLGRICTQDACTYNEAEGDSFFLTLSSLHVLPEKLYSQGYNVIELIEIGFFANHICWCVWYETFS